MGGSLPRFLQNLSDLYESVLHNFLPNLVALAR